MSMRCFCLCLKLYLDLSWFEFGKYIYISLSLRAMALKCHVGNQSKQRSILAEQHMPKSAKKVCYEPCWLGPRMF